jgi:hypothetical protein
LSSQISLFFISTNNSVKYFFVPKQNFPKDLFQPFFIQYKSSSQKKKVSGNQFHNRGWVCVQTLDKAKKNNNKTKSWKIFHVSLTVDE